MGLTQYLELFSLINLFSALILTSFIYLLKVNKIKLKRQRSTPLLDGPSAIIPYFGNALTFMIYPEDISSKLRYYTQKYGSRYRLWIGEKLSIVLADASDIEIALMGNKFLNKGKDFHELFGRAFKNGSFSSEGMDWKKSRKILQHSLKTNVLDNYVGVMNEETEKVIKELSAKAKTMDIFDISDYIAPAPFNIICRTLYDLEGDPISTEQLSTFRKAAGEFLGESFHLMFYPKLIRKIKQQIYRKTIKTMLKDVEIAYNKVILEGKLNKSGNDENHGDGSSTRFIKYLLNDDFSDEDKKAEIVTYSVGGSETLTITICFVLLMLGMHNNIQDKVYKEQELIFGDSDREVTADDIKQMDYLEQVLKEVLRLFPLVPFFFRTAQEDVALGDITLPANTELIFNVFAVHNNPTYFPNPETFDPEHFSKERCENLPKGCYLPFTIGPRNCIGKAFAMYEMKIICSIILRKFRIHTSMKIEDIKLKYSFVLNSADGFKVSINERKK
ncbi:cytochrome P450 4C1-like [Planococcus citri]|uniref:cytochrome P450 4C1-like n=1 Tax=Planococcus citri TaxID=170843 RepID=UPI0031F93804